MTDDPEAGEMTGDDTEETSEDPDRRGGGTGNAGGTDLHAMAMVVAAVHMMRGTRIGWLEKVVSDIPVAIKAETGGPGDDIGLELADGSKVEIQVKKNLQKGSELWDALNALVDGVAKGTIDYGVLAVAPDSSGTIKDKLAADIIKIGQGEEDALGDVGVDWLERLKKASRSPAHCARIRIQTLNLLESQGADRRNAVDTLRSICADPDRAEDALNQMYRDAVALMRSRGRWTIASVITLLRAQGIALRDDDSPAGTATKLAQWTQTTRGSFCLPVATSTLPIDAMLPAKLVAIPRTGPQDPDASAALERYHSRKGETLDNNVFDGEWTGRFLRLNVVVAGPGLGKSTLTTRIAWEYARDGIPILAVSLKRVAAAMQSGAAFEATLEQHGLDGSGVDVSRLRRANLERLVVVADGLDEAGALHDQIAAGLVAYAAGHPQATIIVTTRPIGYETARLADWRHYRLQPPVEKEGAGNLGRLLAASRGVDAAEANCLGQAKRELASTPARDAIVASPLMLGMAATLIIQNEHLPATKAEIYEAMIALFEGRDTDVAADQLTSFEAKRILDIIGWEVTEGPLLTWQQLQVSASSLLARDLDKPALAVAPLFARGFAHWERAGILEKVHHAGNQLVTFVHKTFEEFAAARFLLSMGDRQRCEMERLVDAPALGEVVSFAGALGLGNDLAQLYVDRRGRGAEGQFERALTLAADRDAKVDDTKTIELAEIAFAIAATDAGDRFSIGERLANLARARTKIVGPLAQGRLGDPNKVVKLVAWAAAIAAGKDYHDVTQLENVLDEFVDLILADDPPQSTGIRANRLGRDVDLVQAVAVAALEAQPTDKMADFVDSRLSGRPFTDFGFYNSVRAVLTAHGIEKPAFSWERNRPTASMAAMLIPGPDDPWSRAANRAMGALASSVTGDAPEVDGSPVPSPRPYLQFSALYELADLGSSEASDVFKWEGSYDEAGVAEAIRALAAISRIDAAQLAIEAREIVRRLEAELNPNAFFIELGHPDIPTPDWKDAAALQLDRGRIEAAFHHGSSWLMIIAANLLANMRSTKDDCARLLERSQGVSLFYAVRVTAEHVAREPWRDLLFQRLEAGLDAGTEHIMAALAASDVDLVPATGDIVTAAMRSDSAVVVEAAAKLGQRWLDAGGTIDVDRAKSAYRSSLAHEKAHKGPRRHTVVRAELLKLLIADGSLDDELLTEALSDPNFEPKKVAQGEAAARGWPSE